VENTPIVLTVSLNREQSNVTMVSNAQGLDDLRALYDVLQVISKSLVDSMLAATDKSLEMKAP
jgi:hypothetical protein